MTDTRAGTSRRLQREQTLEQILAAAVDIFARAGFEAASLADIANRAGVKKALVQYHFSTKEQLWKAAASHLWQQRNAHMARFIADLNEGDANGRIRQSFTALVEFSRANPQWIWFMFHEAAASGERLQWLVDNCLRDDYRRGEAFVRQSQDRGLLRRGPPQQILHLISGALVYNLLVAPATLLGTGVDLASEEAIAQQVRLLQEMLAAPQR